MLYTAEMIRTYTQILALLSFLSRHKLVLCELTHSPAGCCKRSLHRHNNEKIIRFTSINNQTTVLLGITKKIMKLSFTLWLLFWEFGGDFCYQKIVREKSLLDCIASKFWWWIYNCIHQRTQPHSTQPPSRNANSSQSRHMAGHHRHSTWLILILGFGAQAAGTANISLFWRF